MVRINLTAVKYFLEYIFAQRLTPVKSVPYTPGMDYNQIIEFYGTARRAAQALQITESAVAMWKIRGRIPAATQAVIQIKSRGRLRADINGAPK